MESPFNVKDQVGPCGILCSTCFLGNGSVANSAKSALDYITMSGIKEWSPMVPEGSELNWVETEKTLNWMIKYAYCVGCEQGGGPPDCTIRSCANSKGFKLCNACDDLEGCTKFEWLGEGSASLKQKLKENSGETKQDFIRQALKNS